MGEIALGKNVEEIKDRAFLGNAVSEISIPASVKKIGLQAFGNTVLTYEGAEAEYTYEPSATRLANEAYRVYDGTDSGESGITVEGLEGAIRYIGRGCQELCPDSEAARRRKQDGERIRACPAKRPSGGDDNL